MAASLIIEEDSGTYQGRRDHPHNGYYAGDFSDQPFRPMQPMTVLTSYATRTSS